MFTGIDFSITSPAIATIHNNGNTIIRCISKIHKLQGKYHHSWLNVEILPYPEWSNEFERYERLVNALISNFPISRTIFIEDYAFGAKGSVFNIAEATWELKRTLNDIGHNFSKVPPTSLKKFATGKGNASKDEMHETFLKRHSISLEQIIDCPSSKSPVSDCIDSFFLARMNQVQQGL